MKHVANIITISRILLSILLICFLNNKAMFISIYMICGISDALDGYIARRSNTTSAVGAKLDSIADFFMFGIVTIGMIIWVGPELKNILIYIYIIAILRITNLLIAAFKYHSFISIHTWGNKLTGFFVFITPILYVLMNNVTIIKLVCIISILTAVEESIIHLTSPKPNLNRRSIFLK